MPLKRPDRNNQWMARVIINNRVIESKMFPAGRKNGPEWREAKEWEEKRKQELQASTPQTPSVCCLFADWLRLYIEHAWRVMIAQTAKEKASILAHFSAALNTSGYNGPEEITTQWAHKYLSKVCDQRGPKVANKYRKNILAAWNWGVDFIEGFPDRVSPFKKVHPFPVEADERYVPTDKDFKAVLSQLKGQDLVMILAYIETGARRTELFRLQWSDVDLANKKIRLTDRKGGPKVKNRERWQIIDDNLVEALEWWKQARPVVVNNVFMQTANYSTVVRDRKTKRILKTIETSIGDPYKLRRHFMNRLCDRAGVKRFGFHSLRHKSAAIVFTTLGGLNETQFFLGHSKATTTDRYIKSAGLYGGQEKPVGAIMGSSLGQAVADHVRIALEQEPTSRH